MKPPGFIGPVPNPVPKYVHLIAENLPTVNYSWSCNNPNASVASVMNQYEAFFKINTGGTYVFVVTTTPKSGAQCSPGNVSQFKVYSSSGTTCLYFVYGINNPDNQVRVDGINSNNKDEYLILPNPASDKIEINYNSYCLTNRASDSPGTFQVEVYDANGKPCIKKAKLGKTQTNRIDVHSLSPGMYIIKILDNRRIITKKLMKIR